MRTRAHYAVNVAKHFNLEPWLYSFIYREFRKIHKNHGVSIATNNYGYYPTDILASDKYQLQMYDEYVKLLESENISQVLEIGCGAGGGLMHMRSRMPNSRFTGMDRCKEAIKTCKYFFPKHDTPVELYSNINDILKKGRRFDAIVSVEAGIYKKPEFFSVIYNLLTDNGVIIYYDNVASSRLNDATKSIERHGFKIELLKDITENVFKACESDSHSRMEITSKYMPLYLRPFNSELERYMCVKDSPRYIKFGNGTKKSFLLKARKLES